MSKPMKQAQILLYLTINNGCGRPTQDLFKSSHLLKFCSLFIKFLFFGKTCKSSKLRISVLFK